jgi:hypothetical protein
VFEDDLAHPWTYPPSGFKTVAPATRIRQPARAANTRALASVNPVSCGTRRQPSRDVARAARVPRAPGRRLPPPLPRARAPPRRRQRPDDNREPESPYAPRARDHRGRSQRRFHGPTANGYRRSADLAPGRGPARRP